MVNFYDSPHMLDLLQPFFGDLLLSTTNKNAGLVSHRLTSLLWICPVSLHYTDVSLIQRPHDHVACLVMK